MACEIPKLSELLKTHINGEVIATDISRLTGPGDNYSSLMLKVDVTVKNGEQEEVMYLVAKCVPPSKRIQEMFHTKVTFVNEIRWYKDIIPTLIEFQKEQGMETTADYFMKVFGTRLSLDPNSKELDEDGVILCENLNARGYRNIDRRVGFNLIQAQEILKKLANFHATTLAIKHKKPEIFENTMKKHLHINQSELSETVKFAFKTILDFLRSEPEYASTVPKILQILATLSKEKPIREQWATITHGDLWVNNMMLNEEEATPKVIILDLQVCKYSSALADLIFFLGASMQTFVGEESFEDLLDLYYEELVRNMKVLNVEEFSRESFEEELKQEAKKQLPHVLLFIPVVMAPEGAVVDVTTDNFDLKNLFETLTKDQQDKVLYIVKKYIKHNWL